MTELSAMEPFDEQDRKPSEDYRQQAREFMASQQGLYLEEDDLHQASEKGWAAGAWMAKAVAERHGWQYTQHGQFFQVMRRCEDMAGDAALRNLTASTNMLHTFFYTRKRLLDSVTISRFLSDVELMLDIIEPLSESGAVAAD